MNSGPEPLRLAMLGMIPGNGHPYSWSAIINGYDPAHMAACPYVMIPKYLGANPLAQAGLPGARVTHIWTDDPAEAPLVAAAALIPHCVDRPEDVLGCVDGVIIATDDGADHVRRAKPFVEAGLPVFIDKPMAVTRSELAGFIRWKDDGARLLSSSGMRYAPALESARGAEWRWITSFTCKTLERYGIHALESVASVLGKGFSHVRCEHRGLSSLVYCEHQSGCLVTLGCIEDAYGSFGAMHFYGSEKSLPLTLDDTFSAFRGQLVSVLDWMHGGQEPVAWDETVELMCVLIAAVQSRENNGTLVAVDSILEEVTRLSSQISP